MRDLTKTYRPDDWVTIVGQDVLVKTLQAEIKNDAIGHAYLLCGPRGTGKTTTARVFANKINAVVIELDAASNNGVDNIRDLREDIQFLPVDNKKYKVYLIDEVHMLSTSAQNAFLKILEEPPEHVIFVLATTDPQKLLLPVLSRCQRFDLKRITQKDIIAKLSFIAEKETIPVEYDALEYIAKSVDGGMRDGIKLLQKCSSLEETITVQTVIDALGSVNVVHLQNMTELLIAHDIKGSLLYFRDLIASGVDIKIFLADMIQYLTDQMSDSIINNNFDINSYVILSDELVDLLYGMRYSNQLKTLSELRFIKICKISLVSAPLNVSGVESGRIQTSTENVSSQPKSDTDVNINIPGPGLAGNSITVDPDLEKRIMDKLSAQDKKFTGIFMELDNLKYQKR